MYELNLIEVKSIAGGNLEAAENTSGLLENWDFELTQAQKAGLLNLLTLSTIGTLYKPESVVGKVAFIAANFCLAGCSTLLGNNLFNS